MLNFKELFEKSYRLSGTMGTKTPIGGKVLQAFKKKVEKLKINTGGLEKLNKEWQVFAKRQGQASSIIQNEIAKKAGEDNTSGISATLDKIDWIATPNIGLENEAYYQLDGDFVININVSDDIDGNKIAKKLKGWINSPDMSDGTEIVGSIDSSSQNIEIRDQFFLNVDNK